MITEPFGWQAPTTVLLRLAPSSGHLGATSPLCHAHSSFDILAYCSHFPTLWCSKLDSGRACASLGPTNPCDSASCPPNFRPQQTPSSHYDACLSTTHWSSFSANAERHYNHSPSFNSSHSCLTTWSSLSTVCSPCGLIILLFTVTFSSITEVCHCGHLTPKSWVSHATLE